MTSPRVTRGRTYQEGFCGDFAPSGWSIPAVCLDDDSEFLPGIRQQANPGHAEAAAPWWWRWSAGLTAADSSIAEWLRGQKVPVLLAVNSVSSPDRGLAMAPDFWGSRPGRTPTTVSGDSRGGRQPAILLA